MYPLSKSQTDIITVSVENLIVSDLKKVDVSITLSLDNEKVQTTSW